MPVVSLQRIKRAQGIGRTLEELSGRDVAEVVRGQIRQQRHADVGRRRTMRDRRPAIQLVVVRRQPVVLRAHKALEEGPGASRQPTQKEDLGAAQASRVAGEWATDPPGEAG